MATGDILEPNFANGGQLRPSVYFEFAAGVARGETPEITQANVDAAVELSIDSHQFEKADADLAADIADITTVLLPLKADLDPNGKIVLAQVPDRALTSVVRVTDQASMLALTADQVQPGDIAVRSDGTGSWMLTGTNPGVLANWTQLLGQTYNPPPQNAITKTGSVNTVTDGTGVVNVAHTLGVAPSYVGVSVTGNSTQPLAIKVANRSTTSVQFYCWNTTNGTSINGGPVAFNYYLVP